MESEETGPFGTPVEEMQDVVICVSALLRAEIRAALAAPDDHRIKLCLYAVELACEKSDWRRAEELSGRERRVARTAAKGGGS